MLNRREFACLLSASAATSLLGGAVEAAPVEARRIKAVAFDAFPIFDPRPIFQLAEDIFPGRGAELGNEWKTRQFEYTWLRTLTEQYEDFWDVTQDALLYAAAKLGLDLDQAKTARLMDGYLTLRPWPDVIPVLRSLQQEGIRIAFLSNFTEKMLRSCIETSALQGFFEQVLSTDRAGAFKPDRRAYQIGVEALRLRKDEIVFAAFAGWDAVGAKAFGYPTFWVNRAAAPPERFGPQPDAAGKDFTDLMTFIRNWSG